MNPYLELWLADVQFISSHAGASIPRCISSGVQRDVSIQGTVIQAWPDGSRRLVLLYLRKDRENRHRRFVTGWVMLDHPATGNPVFHLMVKHFPPPGITWILANT